MRLTSVLLATFFTIGCGPRVVCPDGSALLPDGAPDGIYTCERDGAHHGPGVSLVSGKVLSSFSFVAGLPTGEWKLPSCSVTWVVDGKTSTGAVTPLGVGTIDPLGCAQQVDRVYVVRERFPPSRQTDLTIVAGFDADLDRRALEKIAEFDALLPSFTAAVAAACANVRPESEKIFGEVSVCVCAGARRAMRLNQLRYSEIPALVTLQRPSRPYVQVTSETDSTLVHAMSCITDPKAQRAAQRLGISLDAAPPGPGFKTVENEIASIRSDVARLEPGAIASLTRLTEEERRSRDPDVAYNESYAAEKRASAIASTMEEPRAIREKLLRWCDLLGVEADVRCAPSLSLQLAQGVLSAVRSIPRRGEDGGRNAEMQARAAKDAAELKRNTAEYVREVAAGNADLACVMADALWRDHEAAGSVDVVVWDARRRTACIKKLRP